MRQSLNDVIITLGDGAKTLSNIERKYDKVNNFPTEAKNSLVSVKKNLMVVISKLEELNNS